MVDTSNLLLSEDRVQSWLGTPILRYSDRVSYRSQPYDFSIPSAEA